MIILDNINDTIQVKLDASSATTNIDVLTTFRRITTTTYTSSKQLSVTNGTNYVTIVNSPVSGEQLVVDYISINNTDSINQVVTIKFFNSTSGYTLFRCNIAPSEKIEYAEGVGFKVINTTGAVKQTITQGNNSITNNLSVNILGSDVSNPSLTANTIQDVTGLSFPVTANGTYYFKFIINYTVPSTSCGTRWTINGPSFSTLSYYQTYSLTTAASTVGFQVAYDLPASSNTSSSSSTGNIAIIEGIITPSNDGNVIARFAAELVSNTIIAKAGSVVYYQQIV